MLTLYISPVPCARVRPTAFVFRNINVHVM